MPADYDLDGRTDFAIFRPADGMWWVLGSVTGLVISRQWGEPGDVPVPGDYDGDARIDFAIWRPSSGVWFIVGFSPQQWGTSGDIPVPADYDHDYRTDLAVWRPAYGEWFIIDSSTRQGVGFQWGAPTDVPIIPGPRYQ